MKECSKRCLYCCKKRSCTIINNPNIDSIKKRVGFGPRWLSWFVVESIRRCGDMSLAYDILEENKK